MSWPKLRSFVVPARAPHGAPLRSPARAAGPRALAREQPPAEDAARALSVCVASGKGGTGKSVVSASLACLLARRGPTLLVDADLGVGNAHILQGAAPEHTLVDVVEGPYRLREVVQRCGPQLDLVGAGCGVPRMSELPRAELVRIAAQYAELEREYRFLVVDSAAGLSPQTLAFAAACDQLLLVTTPDLTALTDVYAFYKLLRALQRNQRTWLLVNRAADAAEAAGVYRRIEQVAQRFLGAAPELLGWLPEDRAVARSVNQRRPLVLCEPDSPAACAFSALVPRMCEGAIESPEPGFAARLADGALHARE